MILLKADDTKQFMQKLIRSEAFDQLLVYEFSMDVLNHFSIDGEINKNYLSSDEAMTYEDQRYIDWLSIKPFVSSILKQSHTPTSLKLTFTLNKKATADVQKRLFDDPLKYPVQGFLINVQFDGTDLKVTTGVNYRQFTLDKQIETTFDQMMVQFFKKNDLLMLPL